MAKFLFFALFHVAVCYRPCYAQQYHAQSNNQPLALLPHDGYVVLPSTGFTTTLVRAKRSGRKGSESLDLVNVIIPEAFVLQKLIDSKDVGGLGLFVHDELLVTMAVLPDLLSGQVQWVPIQLDSVVGTRKVAWETLANDCYTRLFNYKAVGGPEIDWSRRRMDLRPVIKRGHQYFTPNQQVLTEYYVLRNYPTWYPTVGDNATINCLAKPFARVDYEMTLEAAALVSLDKQSPRVRGELGTKLLLQKIDGNVYTFWSLTPTIAHGSVAEFGVGELRFNPKIGIISGKYAAYFGLLVTDIHNTFFDVVSVEKLSGN